MWILRYIDILTFQHRKLYMKNGCNSKTSWIVTDFVVWFLSQKLLILGAKKYPRGPQNCILLIYFISFSLHYFFNSELCLIYLLQFFFIKPSNNFFSINIIYYIRPRNSFCNIFNHKKLCHSNFERNLSENVFLFWNTYMATNFNEGIGITNHQAKMISLAYKSNCDLENRINYLKRDWYQTTSHFSRKSKE